MKLLKGINTDIPEKYAPEGTWRDAKNKVFKAGVLVNEQGVEEENAFLDFLPIGELLLPDNSMLYFLVDSIGTSRITRIKDKVATIVTSFVFEFSKSYPIRSESKYTDDLNFEVVFTDNRLFPRFITIDKDTGTIKEDQIEDTLLFPQIKVPNFELQEVGGGGSLVKGSYQVSIAYKFLDGGYTNWISLSNSIFIRTNGGSFRVKVDNIDTSFKEFKLGFVVDNNGVVSAEETLNDFLITGDNKIVSVTGNGKVIVLEDIILHSLTYNRIGDYSIVDGSLYAANVSRDASLEYQSYANNIIIEPINIDAIALDTIENSYADPLISYEKKSFANEEIMAFYIGFRGLDGLPLAAFHIPMTTGASGMNLHTNQNETYPLGKGYPETGGVPDNVRHHKFPKMVAADFLITPDSGVALTATATSTPPFLISNYDGNNSHAVKFASITGTYGTFANDYLYPTVLNDMWSKAGERDVDIDFELDILVSGVAVGGHIFVDVDIRDSSDNFISSVILRDSAYVADQHVILSGFGAAKLQDGDKIHVFMIIQSDSDAIGEFTVNEANYNLVESGSGFAAGSKYFTKPTGIKLSQVVIPQEILGKVQSFEILYAKRTSANSSIVAQDIIYPLSWQGYGIGVRGTIHDFGLLSDKPGITPNKLIGQYLLSETIASLTYKYINETPTDVTVNRDIASSKYIPHDNIAANNEQGEEHIELSISSEYNPGTSKRLLANIVNERDDYYLSLDTQILVSTGKHFLIPESTSNPPSGWVWAGNQWTVTIDELYGGDTYTTFNKIRLTRSVPSTSEKDPALQIDSIKVAKIPVQSKYNHSLREWGSVWYEKEPNFYPPRQELVAAGIHQDVSDNSQEEAEALGYGLSKEYTTYHELDRGFLAENDKEQYSIQAEGENDYPHRVIRTPKQNLESNISSWRQFKPNDYYEQNKDRGEITNLATFDTDKLIIHHERGLFITAGKEKLATNITEIIIGSGDIFERDPKEPIYSKEGYLGTSRKFFNKTTPLGYIFESNNKIFILGKTLEEITKKGVRFHMDSLIKGIADNPYIQDETDVSFVGGMSVAYDKLYERLLVSINKLNSSECWSYSKDLGAWVGIHDSTNNKFFDTFDEFYAIANKKVFKHNHTNKCIYYNGVAKDSYITVAFSKPEDITKFFSNFLWNTTVKNGNTVLPNETFHKIHFWNSILDSGKRTLVQLTDIRQSYNLRKALNIWRYNKLRIEDSVYLNRKKFIDDYIVVKLIFDNTNQYELVISDIETTAKIINI